MGTVFTIDIRDPGDWAGAVSEVVAWLHHVDAVFSTYRPDSELSRIRRGELRVADADPAFGPVLDLCAGRPDRHRRRVLGDVGAAARPDRAGQGLGDRAASDLLRRTARATTPSTAAVTCSWPARPSPDARGASASPTRSTPTGCSPWSADASSRWRHPASPSAACTSSTRSPVGRPPASRARPSSDRARPRRRVRDCCGRARPDAVRWMDRMAGHAALVVTSDGTQLASTGWAAHVEA